MLARSTFFALVLWAASSLHAGPALAVWPHDPTVNLPICTRPNGQSAPVIASDGAGGAIIVWQESVSGGPMDPPADDIYAQRVSASGEVLWTVDGVAVCTAAEMQLLPVVVSDGAGGAVIAWQDRRAGFADDIYAQRIDANGTPQWTANGVAICQAANPQSAIAIATDGAGGAFLAWEDYRPGSPDIYAQRVDAGGVPQWTADGIAVCAAIGTQRVPAISTRDDVTVLAWEDYRSGSADIYAQRISVGGFIQWPVVDGIASCSAMGNQIAPAIVSVGGSGAIVAWSDSRSGFADIYVQRHDRGTGAKLWGADGTALCVAANSQSNPVLVDDGADGAIVAWEDARSGMSLDIYARRIAVSGLPQWAADGVSICAATNLQIQPRIVPTSGGGAIVAWADSRSGMGADVYAQRVDGSGVTQWTADGVAVSTAVNSQNQLRMVSDGADGAILCWTDPRNFNSDIYAQRIESGGFLAQPVPAIVSVNDVPDDQGGKVLVLWNASYLDASPGYGISEYNLWRRVITTAALGALEGGARLLAPGERPLATAGERLLRVTPVQTEAVYWEFIASIPARGQPGYGYTAPTTSDSLPGSIPWNVFFVDADDAGSSAFYVSEVDSGYSVDNLSPAEPAPFTGAAASGSTTLDWGANTEPDLYGYRLHRGASADFVPGPGNLVSAQSDPGHVDVGHVGDHYKLAAVDVHGNLSPYALLTPSATLGVGPGTSGSLSLAPAAPNPAGEATTIEWTQPRDGVVSLSVFDVRGREVARLVSGRRAAGSHVARWDLRDRRGVGVGAGVYLIRLAANGETVYGRVVVAP